MKDFILEFWENQALTHGASSDASWEDRYMLDLEYHYLSQQLRNFFPENKIDRILDAGCANGFVLKSLAKDFEITDGLGVDFSRKLIDLATKTNLNSNLRFQVSDIRDIDYPNDTFDAIYTNRVIINLPTWQDQESAIIELLRLLKPRGILVIQEAYWEALSVINSHRIAYELPFLVEHDFNRYLKIEKVKNLLSSMDINYEFVDTSSIYYMGTRLIRELLTDETEYKSDLNRIFRDMQLRFKSDNSDNLTIFPGIQKMLVIKND